MALTTGYIPAPEHGLRDAITTGIQNVLLEQQKQQAKMQEARKQEEAARKQAFLDHTLKMKETAREAAFKNDPAAYHDANAAYYRSVALLSEDPKEVKSYLDLAEKSAELADKEWQRQLGKETVSEKLTTGARTEGAKEVEASYTEIYDKQQDTVRKNVPMERARELVSKYPDRYALGTPVSKPATTTINVGDKRTEAVADRVAKEPELFQNAYEVVQKSKGKNLAPLRQVLRNANYNRQLYNMMYPDKPPLGMLVIREPEEGGVSGFMKKLGIGARPEYPQVDEIPWPTAGMPPGGASPMGAPATMGVPGVPGVPRVPQIEPPPGFKVD
jgi:hypothetical protein